MKPALPVVVWLAAVLLAAAALAQPDRLRIGEIEFYGYAGLDLNAVRAALPIHEGDQVSEDQMETLIDRTKQAVHATDVNAVCCDEKRGLTIYIGLPGGSIKDVAYNPAPRGTVRFPAAVMELDRQFSDALSQAIGKGAAAEDQSKGHALSADPALRAKQLAMRDYALANAGIIRRVLESSSDSGQRAIAARLMGYARQSPAQIAALVRAGRDPDDEVRNNAVRALWVLAGADPKRAAQIPPASFIAMLGSSSWTDRNKGSLLLEALTRSRDPNVMHGLCAAAREPLLEMARWRNSGHAYAARMMLGRCAGIAEARLGQLVEAGEIQPILDALANKAKN